MSFARPEALWLLAASPSLAAILWTAQNRAARRMRSLSPRFSAGRAGVRIALSAACAAALALALAGPRWGLREMSRQVAETDVVLLVDTSGSMLAHDVSPDRFARVRMFGRSLLRMLPPTARVGLVRVEGEAEVLSPLTLDHAAVENAFLEIVPRGAAVPGSDLGDGLRKAEALLASRESRGRAVVLFSDGEDLGANLEDEASACGRRGIVIETVLAGTEKGGPVPAREGGFQRDGAGRPVVSRAGPAAMRNIAGRTGGVFTDASPPTSSASPLAASLSRLESSPRGHRQREPVDRSPWAFAAAAAAWAASLLPSGRRSG
jgi:Ca-activated chloride channel family protein